MEPQAGARISARAFTQSLVILFALMMVAGLLTRIVPAGMYDRLSVDGREVVDPTSYRVTQRPDSPLWRWFTAPIEVLGAPGNLTVIVIIIFILFIGGSFAVLDRSGIVRAAIGRIVGRFGQKKYVLLLVISFFFMALGAFFGIFEEVVPLVPVMVALSCSLGWDALVGLGMSVLATNLGFSAAITNPFTIGVAQKLAELPLFSGWWLRVPVFIVVYALFAAFLTNYARRIERDPTRSPVHLEDRAERETYRAVEAGLGTEPPRMGRALAWFGLFTLLILVVLFVGPFIPALSDYTLPVVGLLFLFAGIGAGLLSGAGGKTVGRALLEGWKGIAPSIPLILMAASIRHIVVQGGIMDTILHWASRPFSGATPFVAVLAMYGLTLILEFFVPSGSAKAFLMMPILLPLGELLGVTRQTTVLAYCFGDGFSNMVYPTNAVLLISLGLTSVSYPQWFRWSLPLWLWVVLVTVVFMAVAVVIHYGPF
ncbi:MAG: YfcC family protein [Thermoflexales bacterium]|nr:YfcC family protein [Thermoflexales bacterium]